MAQIPQRGTTAAPQEGVYKTPGLVGIKNEDEPGAYRASPVGPKSIDEIGYIPYGNVYERQRAFEKNIVPTGGAYEQVTEEVIVLDDVFILSLTYPPLIIEDMVAPITLESGSLNQVTNDPLTTDTTLTSGTLNTELITYSVPPEDTETVTTLESGTIAVALIVYDWAPEDMDTDTTLESGTLDAILIVYSNWIPEDLVTDTTITGGTLA